MKLPGRDTTRAEAEAVSTEIAALQADIERADATIAVRMHAFSLTFGGVCRPGSISSQGHACGLTGNADLRSVCPVQLRRKQFGAFLHCLDELQAALAADRGEEDGEAQAAPPPPAAAAPEAEGAVAVQA